MEKFFERNPLQVFTVINMVVLGLSVIVLALMNFLGTGNFAGSIAAGSSQASAIPGSLAYRAVRLL